jgi:hypothetical protein
MVKNVKHRDLRQMFAAKVNGVHKSKNGTADTQKSLAVCDEKASSSGKIVSVADADLEGNSYLKFGGRFSS